MSEAPLPNGPVRETFTLNRALEYFSEPELTKQIGQPHQRWAEALLKELIDNGLDACEQVNVPPGIVVRVGDDYLEVTDNGPGIPAETVAKSLDYSVRVTSNALYCSPSRGQLGNALKCVWAAPFVATGQQTTRVEIEARGIQHGVEVALDRIAQTPRLVHHQEPSVVQIGTIVRLHWPQIACSLSSPQTADLYKATRLLCNFHVFNPHASFRLEVEGQEPVDFPAARPTWRKWRTCDPTSAHWYSNERFRELVAGYVRVDQQSGRRRSVRELVASFDGLAQTAKQKAVTESAGLSRALLADLVQGNDLDRDQLTRLLQAMQQASRPVKPDRLGILGKPCLLDCLVQLFSGPDSVRYHCHKGTAAGKPFVVEVALGIATDQMARATEILGLNFSPALGRLSEDVSAALAHARIEPDDPVVLLCHLAQPALDYVDRGKTRLSLLPDVRDALRGCVDKVGKRWREAKRQADREGRLLQRDYERLCKASRPKVLSIKQAANQVMEQAYRHVSGTQRLPANARQIMYAARPHVLALTGGKIWSTSSYFTQRLLPDFIDAHPDLTADWDVVYDARGHLTEPHTGRRIELGTLAVRGYVRGWYPHVDDSLTALDVGGRHVPTAGPTNRYHFALFVEKEGFDALLRAARLAERFDIALMSTKGMSVTAARTLVERLSEQGVTVLVLRDFDRSGFSIAHTLSHDTQRFKFRVQPKVIDLGLRLADARRLGLLPEVVEWTGSDKKGKDPRCNLRLCGATEEEIAFLVQGQRGTRWYGERIELNAMTSEQFIAFLEQQLVAAGVAKVVPEADTLATAWSRACKLQRLQRLLDEACAALDMKPETLPAQLLEEIRHAIAGTVTSWDEQLWNLARSKRADETLLPQETATSAAPRR